jgi:NADH-quinone oxidoreductase subunit F
LKNVASTGEIRIGLGSCCVAGGSLNVRNALDKAVTDLCASVRIKTVGCVGMCHQTPLVEVISSEGVSSLYAKVTPEEAGRIVRRHFSPRGLLPRVTAATGNVLDTLLSDDTWQPVTRYQIDVREAPVCDFLGAQKHIAAEHCGNIDPLDFDEYLNHDGYKALENVLAGNDPEAVIETVSSSQLRGRGGAGFPTGFKWDVVRDAPGNTRYVVMNGDEGDPGAFMDRMLLESYPYRVLEGITIAAFAVGAHEGVLYIRAEYPLAVFCIRNAIKTAEERGYLGDNILNSGFNLHLRVMEGAGAFVCGEETALLASIEGRRGMPRHRPPYPAINGLHAKPTLINNVETYCCIPWIIRHGSDAFESLGSELSKGTKVFSLTGKITRGGLIEVPMGITIREIVEKIGGGVAGGRTFKAVQIGGPSGGCIPASHADIPVDFEELTSAGAIMGSGGLVVLDDLDCMVDIARYFLKFTQEQSCGKCTYCRIGTKRMLEILDRLCEGNGKPGDIDKLDHLARVIQEGSLCGLGRTAPNPVLSTIRYFRDEYEAHIQGYCPAHKCKDLVEYTISDTCIGCTRCAQRCPVDAIPMTPYERHVVDSELCVRCDTCRQVCPVGAVEVKDKC